MIKPSNVDPKRWPTTWIHLFGAEPVVADLLVEDTLAGHASCYLARWALEVQKGRLRR